MPSGWRRAEDWIVAAAPPDDWRARYLFRTWLFGVMFAVPLAGLAALDQQGWMVLANTYLVLSGLVSVGVLRVTGKLRAASYATLVLGTPYFAFGGLCQNPPETPLFIVLTPLLAGFLLPRRESWAWLGISIACGGAAEWLRLHEFHAQGALRSNSSLVTSLYLAVLVVLIVAIVRWFDDARVVALERLEAASRARTIFLANVSHEIRTPVNGVLGLTELVLAGALEPAQREKLELVQRSGQSLVTLIDDLLLVTRAESGQLVVDPHPCDLRGVVHDVVLLNAAPAQRKGLALHAEVAPEVPPWVQLDGVRWRQVFSNLLNNALKFTARGAVFVRLGLSGERLVLTVKDEGVGIAPEVLKRLFRPFEQADTSTTRQYGGTGLGLALSRLLVEAMGGSLTVESQPGVGSVFTVAVTLVEASAPPVAPQPVEVAPPRSRLPVLVVDDNPVNLVVARGLVERAGYAVKVARNGREAVEAVEREDFALVLMDCQMPEMDGLEATRRIRASARGGTPIVALTASGQADELAACLEAGMNACLTKPVSLEMVRGALSLAR